MTRTPLAWALAAALFTSCLVPGTTYLGFSTDVASAPPSPGEVVVAEPAVTAAEGGVYVVTDPSVRYDMFRFGAAWYVYSGGYWYRGPSYRGPFAVVEVRRVPRPVLTLPGDRWKNPHRYARPPGHENDRGRRRGYGDDD
jgi:hypothetical protein